MRKMGSPGYVYRPWSEKRRAAPSKREKDERQDAAFAKWIAEETARIQRQRRFLTRGQGPGIAKLIAAMLDRAWELLDAGRAEAADALLEFVPEAQATALINEFFPEDWPDDPLPPR